MKAFALARSPALVFPFLVGCTGLDPERFGPDGRQRSLGGQAGYSFDAGLGGGSSSSGYGSSGATAGRTAAVGGAGGVGGVGEPEEEPGGGEGGGEESGRGGALSEPTASAGASGRSSAGNAGSAPRGGSGGIPSGGATASGGVAGLGGVSGTPGRGGAQGSVAGGTAGVSGPGGHGGSSSGSLGGSSGTPSGDGGTAGAVPVAEHAFYFSEYVEGSASYKALELTAEVASSLDGCQLVTFSNGSAMGASIALAGNVAAGATYTLCSTTLAELLGAACDRATNLSFNGDDAVALVCDGVTLDVIGQIGVDPGTAWTGPSGSTLNATLRRRCDHLAPDPDGADPFDPDVAFTPLPVDTFDGLGDPACG